MGFCSSCINSDNNRKINKKKTKNQQNYKQHSNQSVIEKNYVENFEYQLIGLKNIGSSCYMNSFLQILFHTPNFINELKKYNNFSNCILIKNLINLSEYPKNKSCLYSIKEFMGEINNNYALFKEEDSQDFGKDLINGIITCIKGKESFLSSENENYKQNISINQKKIIYENYLEKYQKNQIEIEKMFIINESKFICNSKGISNLYFNTCLDIELSFNGIEKNLFSLEELLDYKYQNIPEKNINLEETYYSRLCYLPEILIITIIRTIFKKGLIKAKLKFPIILDLNKYIDNDLYKKKYTKYQLFAVNHKAGNTNSMGHYYCNINIKNKWYIFSDEKVYENNIDFVSENNVGLFYKKLKDE